MIYTNLGSDDDLGIYNPYPPNCKCGSSNTVCRDFWTNTWQCLDCNYLWAWSVKALPPYYDPSFPYPEIKTPD